MYVPWNAPVEALGTTNRTLAFGEVKSRRDKVIAPSLKGKRDGNGGQREGNGDESGDSDGTASSSNVNLSRVDRVRLAAEAGQHEGPNTEMKNVPVSPRTPTDRPERPYGDVRRRRRCRRIKVEPRNVNQTQKVEKTYLQRIRIAQPPGNPSQCLNGAIGPCHRHDQIKIESVNIKIERINDKKAQDNETAYLEHASAVQPPQNDPKCSYRVIGLGRWRQRRDWINIESVKPKIKRINNKTVREDRKTHLERIRTAQPPGNPPKRRYGVIGLIRRRGCIKSIPTIVSRTREGRNAYLGLGNGMGVPTGVTTLTRTRPSAKPIPVLRVRVNPREYPTGYCWSARAAVVFIVRACTSSCRCHHCLRRAGVHGRPSSSSSSSLCWRARAAVVVVIVVVSPWHLPGASRHRRLHRAGMDGRLSSSSSRLGIGLGHLVVVVVVFVVLACTSSRRHRHRLALALAMGISSLSSLCCRVVIIVVSPWHLPLTSRHRHRRRVGVDTLPLSSSSLC